MKPASFHSALLYSWLVLGSPLCGAELQVHPATANCAVGGRVRLVVCHNDEGLNADVTSQASFQIGDSSIVNVTDNFELLARKPGSTELTVEFSGQQQVVPITVSDGGDERVSFQLHIQPIFTAFGCNSGACHGKASGQNGFKLSLLGFDSDSDHASLTRHARGRRVFPASPVNSLLLHKATALAPHGGGERFAVDSSQYETLLNWIRQGAPRAIPGEPSLERVEVFPVLRRLRPGSEQRLAVTAYYSDGTFQDVTAETSFQSNENAIVSIDKQGVAKAGELPGEATLMARYQGLIGTCRVAIPHFDPPAESYYRELPRASFVDDLVYAKLAELGVSVSAAASDQRYLRRVYLDIIGRLPTIEETEAFLADNGTDKRKVLVRRMLENPEYADHWANKWADLLRPNPYRVGIKAVLNYDQWIRDSFRKNKPYDQFVRELVTAQGSTWRNGAATLFRDRRSPDELTTMVSQLFLGIRLECAKCHHHPFEVWSQDDFYSFAAYFGQVGRKGSGLSPPISGGEEIVYDKGTGEVAHPLTGATLPPRPLFGETGEIEGDRRVALAQWMTSKDNPFFAKVMVNRVWKELMGRGIVEPVDDLRVTNPPTNGPLLDELAKFFQDSDFDLKKLIELIVSSHVYTLESLPTQNNASDRLLFSRHYRIRLRAEVVHDAIVDITKVPTGFGAMPPESKSNQIWTHRVGSVMLDTFGRPDPNRDPPCERLEQSTVIQALHLMNSKEIHDKFSSSEGWAAELAKSELTPEEIANKVYLRIYSRYPDDSELEICKRWLSRKQADRKVSIEDIMWALINTPEFFFKD